MFKWFWTIFSLGAPVTGWQKEYTVQRDTEGGDKCEVKDVLFPPQPRISFHGTLNKNAWFPGQGGPIYGQYGYVYQPPASLTLEKGIKITLHLLED